MMLKKKRFKIPVVFEFAGEFNIVATSLSAAKNDAQQHCGLTIGKVHTTLPPDQIEWNFTCHPTKKIGKGSVCE